MHTINPDKSSLHGYFSRDLAPILTINSGESVRFSTIDANWLCYDDDKAEFVAHPSKQDDPLKGHALCGPVAIEGAKAGMVLEVQVDHFEVAEKGWNRGGGGDWDFWVKLGVGEPPARNVTWTLDKAQNVATSDGGFSVALSPFMGVMGMPINEDGQFPTAPPYVTGGNMDCKLLTVGSRLFLPIAVDGGLFSVGDGHAVQGDGEVSGTAIECCMNRVDLTFTLHSDMHLTTPRAYTSEGWITLGFDEDLDEATMIALNAMLDFIMEEYTVSRKDALSLASVAVDMHITQIVNGVNGVHARLPHGAIITP